ncbi:MAG: ferritin-like domain-containing protein [Candidatus Saccharimonadaceae bacterium]
MGSRKLQLISEPIAQLLIKQVAHELKNHSLYKSFANYFSIEGVVDLEQYYIKRAQEEYNHYQWIVDFLTEADVKFMHPAIDLNTEVMSAYIDPFNQTVIREILTTQMLYIIYKACNTEDDYMTCSWLYEKLIKEQIEEENLSRMALTIMEEEADIYVRAEKVLGLLG